MRRPIEELDDGAVQSSLGRLARRWATRKRNHLPLLRSGLRDTVRGLQEGDRMVQLAGWLLIAVGIYQRWRRYQEPSLLYSADLDMDESVGIRVLQKGNIVGEFPVGGSGG